MNRDLDELLLVLHRKGLTKILIANELTMNLDDVYAWENGTKEPTVAQWEQLKDLAAR